MCKLGICLSRIVALLSVCPAISIACPAQAIEIKYRNFSSSAAIGPSAEYFAAELQSVTRATLGARGEINFVKLDGIPDIPEKFNKSVFAAVEAGKVNGGFDAAYISGTDLNPAWGFIYNSAVPFGPSFDEFIGFLYGKSVNGNQTGLELMQSILDKNNKNLVAFPIAGSSEQISGYFPLPIGDAPGQRGIGLAGMCQQPWTFRYLPPGQNVLDKACDNLVARGVIKAKNIKFITAVAGGGSLNDALKAKTLQAFEFATPLDDASQLFQTAENPGTLGARYMHFPGWQQQFLITHMLINKQVWLGLNPAQKALIRTVARHNLISTYGENLAQQGGALKYILNKNTDSRTRMIPVEWPAAAQNDLRAAAIQYLNARTSDTTLSSADQKDYVTILEALRAYVQENDGYWGARAVVPKSRFSSWFNLVGQPWDNKDLPW